MAALSAAWMLCISAPARAQDTDTARERAAELNRRSEAEYRAGRFGHAVSLLDRAYRTFPDPNLVYNRARAHEGAGDLESAIADYELFLRTSETAPDRAAIERRIDTLRYQLVERDALVTENAAAQEELELAERRIVLERRSLRTTSAWPWMLGGTGLAAVIAGGALTALALDDQDRRALGDVGLATILAGAALIGTSGAIFAIELD